MTDVDCLVYEAAYALAKRHVLHMFVARLDTAQTVHHNTMPSEPEHRI